MCGIAGILDWQLTFKTDVLRENVRKMTSAIKHRGPDDEGMWVEAESGIALGHRRLAIVDLSQEGHQPMLSACGRYVIVFNGEVYNYQEIRKELQSIDAVLVLRGHSDTEVMLAAICHWGVEEAVKRFVGMFAFALWDRKERVLSLARDRMGEKPLYYTCLGNKLIFASELKALRVCDGWQGKVDRDAMALLLRHNYIPAPYSIYKDVKKLQPGMILKVSQKGVHGLQFVHLQYWSVGNVVELGRVSPFSGNENEAIEHLEELLKESVRMQMVADVPLGAFLSGGVDSSTIVALMQAQSQRPIKTFTIGFTESKYNEAEYARKVARHLGTDHTELYITPQEVLDVIPKIPLIFDEPFSDSSQLPTYLVSSLARQHVTVSLSGDAGDELFGGYTRYMWGKELWRLIGSIPKPLRRGVALGLESVSPSAWEKLFRNLDAVVPKKLRQHDIGAKLHKVSEMLRIDSPQELYHSLVSHWSNPTSVVRDAIEPVTALTDVHQQKFTSFIEQMMYLDQISYLPDDILVKVDRASMAVSLESRIPFLDHRIIEFAWRLPLSMKIRNKTGKWLLRQVLYKYVPAQLIERPKQGFGVPIEYWLRDQLRDWCENLLDEKKIKEDGLFNPEIIRKKWQEHVSGKRNWHYWLWDILVFQAWQDEYCRKN